MGTCRSWQIYRCTLTILGVELSSVGTPRFIGEIDVARIVGVQFRQSVDEGEDFRSALPAWFTDWMVPHQCVNISFNEERANGRYAGFQREFRSSTKVQDTFLGVCWSGFGVDE